LLRVSTATLDTISPFNQYTIIISIAKGRMSLEAKKAEVYAKIAAYMSSRHLRALEVFRQFDHDRNNSISRAELRHAIETVNPPPPLLSPFGLLSVPSSCACFRLVRYLCADTCAHGAVYFVALADVYYYIGLADVTKSSNISPWDFTSFATVLAGSGGWM
jgi:hypothetical protein